ncbi:MAG: TIGR02757 family protein [Paludibacteraceae bacterium]|nr:TIGR02757 family protein [Paludibacteraceae bacterium]
MMDKNIINLLIQLADRYETQDFLQGDPSWFMHQVSGIENQETMAFIASALSYGNRKQFMPKIEQLLIWSGGEPQRWIENKEYEVYFSADDNECFYRLYNKGMMHSFFAATNSLFLQYGSFGKYIEANATTGFQAIEALTKFYSSKGISGIIPQNTTSTCKRLCMFLRWMVRNSSPVDLGIWSEYIDRRTLIIPMDTHVINQATRLGLLNNKSASMNTAILLTDKLKQAFPDDPLKGDFALFGYGINHGK